MEERKGPTTVLLKVTCNNFRVGRATCSSSSVVTVYPDRLEYKFHHPQQQQSRIDMVMYFKDMLSPELSTRSGPPVFTFRVGKPLRHFLGDYDVCDPQHVLVITLGSRDDARQFCDAIQDKLPALQIQGGL